MQEARMLERGSLIDNRKAMRLKSYKFHDLSHVQGVVCRMFAKIPLHVCSSLIFLSSLISYAGEPLKSDIKSSAPPTKPLYRIELDTMVEFLDASPAGPSGDVWRTELSMPLFIPLSDNWRLGWSLSTKLSDFESAPFDEDGLLLWDFGTFASLSGKLNEKWSVAGSAFVSSTFEDGAGLSDSVNGGAGFAVGYQWSPTLRTSLGALYIHRSFGDSLVVPNIRVDWRISEALSFTISGLKTELKYNLTQDFGLLLAGEFYPGGGKLKDRKNTAARQFEDRAFRFGTGFSWQAAENLTLSLLGGVAFHEISLRDEDDNELTQEDLDLAPYVGLKASYRF
jgi:hypothetical protein